MGKWRRTRLILLAWAILVLCLVLYAMQARHARQDHIAARAIAALRADAESGTMEGSDYLWSANGYGWQGPMVHLIEQGRHYPEMERVMLLLEARRVHDWIYLYPEYRNADLRECLMRHCLEHYPDDPMVHWAAGQLKLIGGEYSAAADELKRAMELGFDPQAANVPAEHFRGRYATALILAGRMVELLAILDPERSLHSQKGSDPYEFIDLLCRLGMYVEATKLLEILGLPEADYPRVERHWQLLLRACFWSGDIERYRAAAVAYTAPQPGEIADRTWAMVALLDHNFALAAVYSGERPAEQEWWSEWINSWDYYRLLADAYAVTGDPGYMAQLDHWRDSIGWEIEQAGPADDASWEVQEAQKNKAAELISLAGQKARAHALRGEWDAAAEALGEADAELSYRKDATYEAVSALVAISRGEQLPKHSLAGLASTGAVVNLLLGPELNNAAEVGGMTVTEAREQLIAAIRPERSNYWRWDDKRVLEW